MHALHGTAMTTLVAALLALTCVSATAQAVPDEYVVDYPMAGRYCPPVRAYFHDIQQTVGRAGGRTFRQQPNGGYGLAIQQQVGGQHLLHLGADVGWYRVGEPVYSIAEGVVRLSEGPPPARRRNRRELPSGTMAWGNVVAIEHRLGDEQYAISIYGHLGPDRRVDAGQIVKAGEQIGTIGKQSRNVNGGYKPHLHFGIRKGRFAEPGTVLMDLTVEGTRIPLKVSRISDTHVVLEDAKNLPSRFSLAIGDKKYRIERIDGEARLPAAVLWHVPRPRLKIVGYGLSTEGWYDPTEFLRRHQADVNPAPLDPPSRARRSR